METEVGEMYDELFEILCPKCSKPLEIPISYPTFDEVIAYGSEEEKQRALEQQEKLEEWRG